MRAADQRPFRTTRDSLGTTRTRVFVFVSREDGVSEGTAPIRRVLIFDDHPATIRLLSDIEAASKPKNNWPVVAFSAVIILLLLAMFWPLL